MIIKLYKNVALKASNMQTNFSETFFTTKTRIFQQELVRYLQYFQNRIDLITLEFALQHYLIFKKTTIGNESDKSVFNESFLVVDTNSILLIL